MGAEEPRRILAVCTGNICRSPAAERLIRQGFADLGTGDAFLVTSAGTQPLEGELIDPAMAYILEQGGIDTSGFAARRLTEKLVRNADLVLAMTREHRTKSVQMWPGALKRTFTLEEFARLATRIDSEELAVTAGPGASIPDRLGAVIHLAPLYRSSMVEPDLDDVPDPYRRGTAVFEAVHAQINRAVDDIMSTIGPARD